VLIDIDTHPITEKLRSFGLTDADLEMVKFKPRHTNEKISESSFRGPACPIPQEALFYIVGYCTLKKIKTNPAEDQSEQEEELRRINECVRAINEENADATANELARTAEQLKDAQSKNDKFHNAQIQKARKPRKRRVTDDLSMQDLVIELLKKSDLKELQTKELWPHFRSLLDEHRLAPEDVNESKNGESAYSYCPALGTASKNGRRLTIKLDVFRKLVSKAKSRRSGKMGK